MSLSQGGSGRGKTAGQSRDARALHWQRVLAGLIERAAAYMAPSRATETARQLLGHPDIDDDGDLAEIAATGMVFGFDLAVHAPSATGSTAIGRLSRAHKPENDDEAAAVAVLATSTFRLLRLEQRAGPQEYRAADLATGEHITVFLDDHLGLEIGFRLAMRAARIDADEWVPAGPVIPVDDAMMAVARPFMRPGGRGIGNQNRCAHALYRHLLRFGCDEPLHGGVHGTAPGSDFPFDPESGPGHALAFSWAGEVPDAATDDDAERDVREHAGGSCLVEALVGAVLARGAGRNQLAEAYENVVMLQMDTIARRVAAGTVLAGTGLEHTLADVDALIRARMLSPQVRSTYDALDRRFRAQASGRAGSADSADLGRAIARIRALREKTVAQGCTEEEALAAASKVAEMLDRYGLTLSEVELRGLSCRGVGIETGRRRAGVLDDCVPAVARFCDCNSWTENGTDGSLRHVLFGLPADVSGAEYLYERVAAAFDSETERFKAGPIYGRSNAGNRRSATHSFQMGLARGIVEKLDRLKAARTAGVKSSSGRDLVPLKRSIVDDEMERLGLQFTARDKTRRLLSRVDAFKAGQRAGARFQHADAVTAAPGVSVVPGAAASPA